jgi:C4-dicarboxylate-specific signal transduction histidine kinase
MRNATSEIDKSRLVRLFDMRSLPFVPMSRMSPTLVKILLVGTTAVIFLIDWLKPVELNFSIFYACVIVMLAWTRSLLWLWSWILLTVALTLLELTYGHRLGESLFWIFVINRYITCGMLITTGGFVHFSMHLARQLDVNKRLREAAVREHKQALTLRKMQEELARVTRLTTMGELAASIAHEVNQPISGVVTNGNACLRWLAKEKSDSPNLVEARQAMERIVRDGSRVGQVVQRLRDLFKKAGTEKEPLDINDAIREVTILTQSELESKRVSLRMELADQLPRVSGDRVQLQQVLLNLILNGAEAMSAVEERARDLVIRTHPEEGANVRVEVIDSGAGIDPGQLNKIFDAFYTTKAGGMGMGLSISRSIVENHGGRLSARPNDGHGATFQFTVLKHN